MAEAGSGGTARVARAGAPSAASVALAALVVGAVAMGISPVFVRLAGIGPFASAFWRVLLALPLLYAWAALEARLHGDTPAAIWRADRATLLAGLFFAGDLTFWHLAILNTSVANATFLATLAPVWVVLLSVAALGERVGAAVYLGLALCVAGALALIGASYTLAPGQLAGDLYGLVTSLFFGGYFLAVRSAGQRLPPGRVTLLASLVTAAALLVIALALEPRILPRDAGGLAALVGVAAISHAGGQGLLAFALGHLPAAFSSLVIFLEAIAAALFGWIFLGEALGALQALGGALILAGIFAARPRRQTE